MFFSPLPPQSSKIGHLVLGQLPTREKVIYAQNPQELFNSAISSARIGAKATFDNAYAKYHVNTQKNQSQQDQIDFGQKLCYGLYIDKKNQLVICHVCGCSKNRISDLTAHILTPLHVKRFTEWADTIILAEKLKKKAGEQTSELQQQQQQQQDEKSKNTTTSSEPVVKTKNRSEAETLKKLQKKAKKQNSARLKEEKKEAARIFDDVNNNSSKNKNSTDNSIPKVTKPLRELEKERHQMGKRNLVRALKLVLHSHKNLVLFNFTPTTAANVCLMNVASSNLSRDVVEEDFKTRKTGNKSSTVAFVDEVKVAQKLPIRRDRVVGDEGVADVIPEQAPQESHPTSFASPPPSTNAKHTLNNNDNSDCSSNSNSNPKKMLQFDSKGRLDPDVAKNLAQNGFFKSFSPNAAPSNPKSQATNDDNSATSSSVTNRKPITSSTTTTTTTRFSALTNAEGEVISNSKYQFCEYMRLDLGESCGLEQLCPISYNHDGSLDENEGENNEDEIQSGNKLRNDEEYVEKTKTQKGLLSLFAGKTCCFHQEETTNLLVGTISDAFVSKKKRKTENSWFVNERRVLVVPDPQFGLPGQTFKWVDLEDIYCLPKVPENNTSNGGEDSKAEYNRLLSIEIEKLRAKVTKLATLPKTRK